MCALRWQGEKLHDTLATAICCQSSERVSMLRVPMQQSNMHTHMHVCMQASIPSMDPHRVHGGCSLRLPRQPQPVEGAAVQCMTQCQLRGQVLWQGRRARHIMLWHHLAPRCTLGMSSADELRGILCTMAAVLTKKAVTGANYLRLIEPPKAHVSSTHKAPL